ncbi:hypothetical protein PAE0030a [Pyrobaculum aerophilum str. IM2]|uniref:Uncharacterized protein n=2 Tax=Pyrobaculum aerophilum TaxID=13773 RepID=Q8ZZX5_PYRAE|nr:MULTISPECIES: hypothetical protein [Pyrobaculum]AAL62514.1 hypothetical protein PAE0030a [Pyrobaculum aerophilum str. IM2]HII47756.1 hypothetical protein [Pyrobaculum aerophilum]
MEKTTIAVSKKLWQELLSEKERLAAKTMEEAISKILQEYRELKRRIAILEIIEKTGRRALQQWRSC